MTETVTSSLLINEKIIEIENPSVFKWNNIYLEIIKQLKNKNIIKLNLVKSTKHKLYFNVVCVDGLNSIINKPFISQFNIQHSTFDIRHSTFANICCLIIPTGIGASFGGYAGDANPIAKVLADTNKYLLTHPNVVNGAVLSDVPNNLIYLEGYFMDQFLLGNINIIPTKQNKIGVIFDRGINEKRLEYEINVLNALKSFYGCHIEGYSITKKPLTIEANINEYGFSSGNVKNLEYVIEIAQRFKSLGITAIAICTAIPDLELNKSYIAGSGIDPIGGIESIISRSASASCGLVCAHAPILVRADLCVYPNIEDIDYKNISSVSASEYIAQTFLPSVISGLRFAPTIKDQKSKIENCFSYLDLNKVIIPYNAFGSPGVLALSEIFENITLIKENKTSLSVDPNHLNIKFNVCSSYIEMISEEKIRELGIDPNIFKRPVEKVHQI